VRPPALLDDGAKLLQLAFRTQEGSKPLFGEFPGFFIL